MKPTILALASLVIIAGCNSSDENKKSTMEENKNSLDWIHTGNIYEVNLRQYTQEGTFNAFVKELPRLKNMGVKVLWFMPITPIAEQKKKGSLGSYYAAADYTSISPEFGTLEDFKNLVKSAHDQGFKVIIDWVANHTGWGHTWTKEHPEYYLKDSATNDFKIASGMDDIIELDYQNPETVNAMIAAMKFWVRECDIDGFRCDLASWVELPFWKKARPEVDSVKPLFWLGEYDELENPDYAEVFHASYSWKWMHKTRDFYQHNLPLSSLDSLLQQYDRIGNRSMRSWFTTNHDENSWNGTEYEKYGDFAMPLAVFSCTWNGIPLIYSGQELPNHKRLEFFEKDVIKWSGEYKLNGFYNTLFKLKVNNPALRGGDENATTHRVATTDNVQHIFSFLRKNGDKEVLVLLNLSKEKVKFEITDDVVKGKFKNVFTGADLDLSGGKSFEMDAWRYYVFEK